MKTLLTFAAVVCFWALPAYSADGQLSNSSLTRLGLAGMTPISDVQGLEIRGLGVMEAMGINKEDGDHDKDDHHKNKHEHKHHEKHEKPERHEKHEHHFKCDFHAKPSCNLGTLCHLHGGKAG
jgi:ABC-type Zn2+ transport system substrate-binding protein/surface adhesin